MYYWRGESFCDSSHLTRHCRCLLDNDDEVRDRSLLYLEVLKQKQKSLSSAFILNRKRERGGGGKSVHHVILRVASRLASSLK